MRNPVKKSDKLNCHAVYLKENGEVNYVFDALFFLRSDAEEYAKKTVSVGSTALIKEIPVKGIDFKVVDPTLGSIGNFIPV